MKKKKTNITIILILLLLLLAISPKPQSVLVPGSGTFTFTDENNAHVIISASDCNHISSGPVEMCGSGLSFTTIEKIKDWELNRDTCQFTFNGNSGGCRSFRIWDNRPCITTQNIEAPGGTFCDWTAEFDLTSGITNGEEIPIVALILLGGLGFIIIKGKKWLR